MSKDEDFKLGAACTVVLGVIVVVLFCMNPVAGSGSEFDTRDPGSW